jgi:hypothetical protein
MWMWIVGAALIVVAGVLFFLRQSQAAKLEQVTATETSTCKEVADLCEAVGEGTPVEVKGSIEPKETLQAELSGNDCVCFRSEVERKWEKERWETDTNGNRRLRTRRGTDTVSQNEVLQPFYVRDETGRVLVDPEGADIDWVESVDRFERGEPEGGTLSLGGFQLNLGGVRLGSGRRTIGYRFLEWILPPHRAVYLLGGARLVGGEAGVAQPGQRGEKFLISIKSEEEIVAGTRRAILWLTVGAIACAGAGAVLLAMGLTGG